jgi:DNA-binding GntR family transcriptional regulator
MNEATSSLTRAAIQGPTLIEQTYTLILDGICAGRLQPGERLNQDELAARMNVSRQPVGQAMSILKSQGFVRDAGRRGLIVAPIEQDFFRTIYELREAIDPMAARLTAERGADEGIAAGEQLVAKGRQAIESGSVQDLVAADMEFHLWICRLAGNPLLVETVSHYWNHLRRAMGEVLRPTQYREQTWKEHEAIFRAIAARDTKAAEECALRHVKGAAERVVASLTLPKRERGLV